jgi:hypothetical protein
MLNLNVTLVTCKSRNHTLRVEQNPLNGLFHSVSYPEVL